MGGEQVVRGADGVHVAGEMEVDVLHRHDLGVAAAGGAALHAETGAERGLPQADRRVPADAVQPVAEADRGGRLAFARGRRRHGGHQDELAVGPVRQTVDESGAHLGLVAAVSHQRALRDSEPLADFADRPQNRFAGNFDIALGHGGAFSSPDGRGAE